MQISTDLARKYVYVHQKLSSDSEVSHDGMKNILRPGLSFAKPQIINPAYCFHAPQQYKFTAC